MLDKLYYYKAYAVSVVDGDSLHLEIDIGFHLIAFKANSRLAGINAPELNSKDPEVRAKAQAAKAALADLVILSDLVVKSEKLDKYGRPLVRIYAKQSDGTWLDVNKKLVDDGHAIGGYLE
jgi:endonuclease YncB( thermonuclease family)